MNASRVFKKDNGDKYRVEVSLSTGSYESKYFWQVFVYFCKNGKRKFNILTCEDNYKYRNLSLQEQEKCYMNFILDNIPAEWISQVQNIILSELSKPLYIID